MLALTLHDNAVRWVLCKGLGRVWPAAFWSRLSNLRLRDLPEPSLPGPRWVRLETILGGICGTDLTLVGQRTHPASFMRNIMSFPVVLGHENVARIAEIGPEVSGWKVGDRVVVEPSLSCVVRGVEPLCRACSRGLFALCDQVLDGGGLPAGAMIGLNRFTSGSWAPQFVAHETQLHAVPDELRDEDAVLVDPLACSLHACLRRPPVSGERVLVQGAGVVAMGVVLGLRALGYDNEITALVRRDDYVKRLTQCGASQVLVLPGSWPHAQRYDAVAEAVGGRRVPGGFGNQMLLGGYDLVYECVGTGRSMTDALKFVQSRGTLVALGTSGITLLDTTPLWFSELSVVGAYGRQIEEHSGGPLHTYELVFDLMRRGRLKPLGWLTHTFELRDYRRAFAMLLGRNRGPVVKAAFGHAR